ncbi:MAG: hypothetical protein ACO281_12500 [Burkholderiaceae bacterium]|jgi:hypothetical protein|nr:hypothetical protein [Betaproteobacteria bacterium]NDE32465.1 hypothetical protein [Betaproteobacteria bacterium]
MQVMINNHLPFEVSVDADRLRDLAWTQLRAVEIDVVAIRVDLATLDSAKPHTMFSAHVAVRLKQGTLRGETFIGHGQTIELALHHALVGVRSSVLKISPTQDDPSEADEDKPWDGAAAMISPRHRGK